MTDPVIAADNFTYDRSAISQWMDRSNLSPATQQPLPHKVLAPNVALRNAIFADLLQ